MALGARRKTHLITHANTHPFLSYLFLVFCHANWRYRGLHFFCFVVFRCLDSMPYPSSLSCFLPLSPPVILICPPSLLFILNEFTSRLFQRSLHVLSFTSLPPPDIRFVSLFVSTFPRHTPCHPLRFFFQLCVCSIALDAHSFSRFNIHSLPRSNV